MRPGERLISFAQHHPATTPARTVSMRSVGLARGSVAIASGCFAALTLVYGHATPLGQSLPAGMPGRDMLLYGDAILLLAGSIGLCFERAALPSAIVVGACYALWALANTPEIVSH